MSSWLGDEAHCLSGGWPVRQQPPPLGPRYSKGVCGARVSWEPTREAERTPGQSPGSLDQNLPVSKMPRWFACMLKFEEHSVRAHPRLRREPLVMETRCPDDAPHLPPLVPGAWCLAPPNSAPVHLASPMQLAYFISSPNIVSSFSLCCAHWVLSLVPVLHACAFKSHK